MSTIRLSNRDVNHIVCVGGEIEDVKFSAEKAIAVERAGSDAWVKFLVKEVDDMGMVTRSYVTTPSEFFINCNGDIYPLYAETAEIPEQTVTLKIGRASRRERECPYVQIPVIAVKLKRKNIANNITEYSH